MLSYLDLAVIGGLLAVIALALLTIGRPWLPAALRDPRRLLGAVWPKPATLRAAFGRVRDRLVGRLRPGRLPAARDHRPARPRIQRSDPALVFALLLIGLGLLGGSLARSAADCAGRHTPAGGCYTGSGYARCGCTNRAATGRTGYSAAGHAGPGTADLRTKPGSQEQWPRRGAAAAAAARADFNSPRTPGCWRTHGPGGQPVQRAQGLRATGVVNRATVVALNRCGGACAAGRPESGNK